MSRPTQHPASNSTARKRLTTATFAPLHVRQQEVDEAVREACARAWDEGYEVGAQDEYRQPASLTANPYEAAS